MPFDISPDGDPVFATSYNDGGSEIAFIATPDRAVVVPGDTVAGHTLETVDGLFDMSDDGDLAFIGGFGGDAPVWNLALPGLDSPPGPLRAR